MLQLLRDLVAPPTHRVVVTAATEAGRGSAERALNYLLAELPELLLAALVQVDTGKPLATYTTQSQWRPGAVAEPFAAALRQLRAAQAGTAEPGLVEEVLVTLKTQVHVLRLTPNGQHFLYLAVDGHDANLALTREVLRGGIEQLTLSAAT